ncbi:MAG: sulfite exporter TauE/SafE family protein [Candidatus Hydrogenedentota bacterium]|nr:MAG: sulfite exporter TauE/SafE family protein [Candidatus Hydrogenedentota bacterium]
MDTTLIGLIGIAFTQGLVGSVHCIGMCGPFVFIAQSASPGLFSGFLYNFSRTLSYAFTGALLGLFGKGLNRFFLSPVAAILGGILIFVMGLAWLFPQQFSKWTGVSANAGLLGAAAAKIQKYFPKKVLPVFFGLISAFLPCGLLYPAYGLALSSASPYSAAIIMFAFGLGTSPTLFTLGLASERVSRIQKLQKVKKIVGFLMILAGLLIIVMRFMHGMK